MRSDDSKPTQTRSLLAYLRQHGDITPKEAAEDLGIWRLAARVSELRDLGIGVRTFYETNANGGRHARYVLCSCDNCWPRPESVS